MDKQDNHYSASRREYALVLFSCFGRWTDSASRVCFETLQYLQRLTAYGGGYRSCTEQYLDSFGMFRDAVISILAVIAKQEQEIEGATVGRC